MDFDEIRFRVLCRLYEKYWSSGESFVNTNGLITELNLDEERNVIYKNVIYLHDKNLISGKKVVSSEPLPAIQINTNGIDFVEECLRQSLDNIPNEEIKQKLSLVVNDTDKSSRIQKYFDFAKNYSPLISNVVGVVGLLLR